MLEAALYTTFDASNLAVYADELQRLGDPRGELIAIDLLIDTRGKTPELAARRGELLASLLPGAAADPVVECKYGFLEIEIADAKSHAASDAVLLRPCGRFVRAADIHGDRDLLVEFTTSLACQERPFLRRLAFASRGDAFLPARLLERAIQRMPRLERLEVHEWNRVIPLVVFPTVRELFGDRHTGIAALTAPDHAPVCFPRVHTIDLVYWFAGDADTLRLLSPAQFPELRVLDVSRSRPDELLHALRTLPVAPQLEGLRVPAVLTEQHAINLQAAIDRMPRLGELEFAGRCAFPPPRHPHAAIRLRPSA